MPIYDQSYREYDGQVREHFRWVAIIIQELRILYGRRMFYLLLIFGCLHIFLRFIQLYIWDIAPTASDGVLEEFASGANLRDVGGWLFFDFLRIQSPLLFLIMVYSGAGLICNDFRNNLVEVYFSKPLTWKDYVLGKIGALAAVGLGLTAVPALFLLFLHVLFIPSWETVTESAVLVFPVIAFSVLLVGSISLCILASSALVDSSRVAGIALFMILFADSTIGPLLAIVIKENNVAAIAYPVSMNRLGELLFNESVTVVDIAWYYPILFVASVWAFALFVLCRKARRAELG